MKPQSKKIERTMVEWKLSVTLNCRDMRGKLFAVIQRPERLYEYGNIVKIHDKRYIVKGICVVNGKLNINFEEATVQ